MNIFALLSKKWFTHHAPYELAVLVLGMPITKNGLCVKWLCGMSAILGEAPD
jgi:hypothetical protein